MTAYAPASSLGWLDLDVAASERVATMLRALEEPGTLDVLGLGTVRDAFSDLLTPGTSTIQTRLRYFLFLPWTFEHLARQRVEASAATQRLRDQEKALIHRLVHLGPNQGVIGFNARDNLKRMPSEAYWGGLGSWGIRRFDLSISDYAQHTARAARRHAERDDDDNPTLSEAALWARLPATPSGFLHDPVDFDLTADEANFLLDHVRHRHPHSLLARYAGHGVNIEVSFPWELPPEPATPLLRERLRHAQNFSELTTGPQYAYNVLLARHANRQLGRDTSQLEAAQLDRLADWAGSVADRADELTEWVRHSEEFWALVGGDTVHPRTKEFIGDLLERAVVNPAGFADDPFVASRIIDRERHLKGKRARLSQRSALENWNGAPFGGPFDYRWGTTSSYLRDLDAALSAGS